MAENLSNGYSTTINQSGGINSSVTTLPVTSATGAPSINFRLVIDSELMLVTAVSGTNFTVTRGIEGTTATSHANGTLVQQVLTKAGLNQYILDNYFRPMIRGFSGSGTPVVATDVCQHIYIPYAATVTSLALSCISAPTGNFQVTIKRSSDNGSTFPDTIGSVTISSGNKQALTTSFTNAALAAGDWLRCDIISVNSAADWNAQLIMLTN